MKIKSFPRQTRLCGLALLALGLAHTAPAQTFTQSITYSPTGGANFYDTIEAFIVGDPADAFANPGLSNFYDGVPSSWRAGLRDRRQVIAGGIAPGGTTSTPLRFDLNFEGLQRPMVVDLAVWDGGKKGTLVDTVRLTLDGAGGYESAVVPEGQLSWAGVPAKWVRRGNLSIPPFGRASSYPSAITVRNLPIKITKVMVELKGLTHTRPSDLEFLLVGPGGQKALIMADAGGTAACSNVHLLFDDNAPQSLSAAGPLVSGTFKPTVVGTPGTLPMPAPGGPYASPLSVFAGTLATGTWSLYVLDDLAGNSGNLRFGWALTIQ